MGPNPKVKEEVSNKTRIIIMWCGLRCHQLELSMLDIYDTSEEETCNEYSFHPSKFKIIHWLYLTS